MRIKKERVMPQKEFQVTGLYGEQDISILENALQQIVNVRLVEYLPETKRVTVEWSAPTEWKDIEAKLETLGYFPGE
jgi:hypothetical protein